MGYESNDRTAMSHSICCARKGLLVEFKQAEIDYINKTIQDGFENNNCKPFWRYIKAKKQDNIGVAPLKSKGNLFSEGKEKAQILVEQFYSVFSKKENRTLPTSLTCLP